MMKVAVQFSICFRHIRLINSLNCAINNQLLNMDVLKCGPSRYLSTRKFSSEPQQLVKCILVEEFGSPDVLKVKNVAKPFPEENQILIRVEAAGINPVDTYIREGIYKILPELPFIPGKEIAGTVERIGKGSVNKYNLKVGDRVFARLNANGGYAEYVVTDPKNVYPLVSNLTFAQGASMFVTYFTAYRALVLSAKIGQNESLFIHGASGGVGTAALQIAKHLGVQKIGATAGTAEGMEMLKELGAHYVFNHRKKGHTHEAKTVMCNNTGFNVILENFAHTYLGDDCDALAYGGRIAVVGCRASVEISPRSLMVTEGQIIGVNLGHFTEKELEECADFLLKGMADGWIKPAIEREYTFDEAARAHDDMINRTSSRGKLVFRMLH